MIDRFTGLIKILGITVLLAILWGLLAYYVPEKFLVANNIENLLRRTALFGFLGIGVAFVIISSGIDLSIGSLVCMSACTFALLLHVDYVPVGTTDIWQIRAEAGTIAVAADHEFSVGEEVWYYKDKRNKGLVKIVEIGASETVEGHAVVVLKVDPPPKRDADPKTGKAPGTMASIFNVNSVDKTSVKVESDFPSLKHNDKIQFVHQSKTARTTVVDSVSADGSIEIANEDSGLNDTFRAVPIRKTPFMSIPLALLSVLGIALLLGIVHGLLITKVNMQPFIVTLCGLLIYRGISRWITNDQTVGFIEYSESLGEFGRARLETGLQYKPVKTESWCDFVFDPAEGAEMLGISYSFFLFVAATILAIMFLNLTVWGRHMMAVGRNEEAARYFGINTHRITILAYVLCAVLTGIGGVMAGIDSNSIAPSSFGNFFELYAIAAAVLGGCSLRGGEGSILGVVVGTALMQTLYNLIVLLKIPQELEFTIIGAVILIGVAADEVARMFAAKFRSKE